MSEIVKVAEGEVTLAVEAAAGNPARVYVASLSTPEARRTMTQALDSIARLASGGRLDIDSFPFAQLRYEHVAAIRALLIERYAVATVNKMLSALRGTLKAAWRLGQMTAEQYRSAASVTNVRGEVPPAGRALTPGELAALMDVCADDLTPAGARDAAIIAVLYAAGLRRAEVVALDLDDYDQETGELRIAGKGHKTRLTWLNEGAVQALADWLAIRGGEPGPLFLPINRGGRVGTARMTTQAIYKMLAKRARQAGVRKFSPHDLRRTFISDLLDRGADVVTIQKMAGHASVTTTARYDRRPETAKQRAAALLHIPYRRRGL